VPDIPGDDEEIQRNRIMIDKYQQAVEEWTQKIKETMAKEEKRARDRTSTTA